jgi:hypothetical protein
MGRLLFLLLALLVAGPLAAGETCTYSATSEEFAWTELQPGLDYAQWSRKASKGVPRVHAHLLRVNLDRGYSLLALRTQGGGLKIEEMIAAANDAGAQIVAGLNGDYFSFGDRVKDSLGLFITSGQVLRYPANTATLAQDEAGFLHIGRFKLTQSLYLPDGRALLLDAANEDPARNGLYVYSGLYKKKLPGYRGCTQALVRRPSLGLMVNRTLILKVDSAGPSKALASLEDTDLLFLACGSRAPELRDLSPGAPVYLETSVAAISHSLLEAVSGGPRVLRGAAPGNEIAQEGFSMALRFYLPNRHPRSAAGISADGRTLYLVAVEGRGISRSSGIGAVDSGCLLAAAGASDALLFDGGGSSVLYGNGRFLNKPHLGRRFTFRDLANAVAVRKLGSLEGR